MNTNNKPNKSKVVLKGTPSLNNILGKLYENNYKEYIAINKILNISINLVKSNKIIYRTLFTIILNTFEEAVGRVVKGNENNNSDILNNDCKGQFNNVSNNSNSWDNSCYKKLLVDPSVVIDLLKDSMLFQLSTINVDFDKIISSKKLYKDDIQLSNATKQIMESINAHKESNVAIQRLYDVVTRHSSKDELSDRNSLFEILIIFKEINNNYDNSRKLYNKIRKLKDDTTKSLNISNDNKKKISKNIKKWLNIYKDLYTKLSALIDNNKTNSSDNSVESLLKIEDEQKISVLELNKLQNKLSYIIGERINSLKSHDKNPSVLTDIITGKDGGKQSNVTGKMIKQLFILFYVFYLSITAQSLEIYIKGIKFLNIELPFTSNS
jgi:hypothetical protein